MNLLMIAPLYDNKGTVRYFIGCQIDVSSLIEGGHGLESFQQLLSNDRADSRFGGRSERKPADVLGQLGAMFDEEESNVMKSQVQRYGSDAGGAKTPNRRTGRRILGMDDSAAERAMWPHPSLGPSGRLPGVYQNVSLVVTLPDLPGLTDVLLVPSRATLPISPNHIHFSSPAHSRPASGEVSRSRRRSVSRQRRYP